jgi:putative FmdB family regulatory protein
MPSYDLVCPDCAHRFEVFRTGFLRASDRVCPRCGSARAEQRLTGFVAALPRRGTPEPRVVGFRGSSCCGGAHAH